MQGTNAKLEIFRHHSNNQPLIRVIKLSLDPFVTFGIVKVPWTDPKVRNPMPEGPAWARFFGLADKLSLRQLTGNEATSALCSLFELCSEEDEYWMRAVLEKRLGIGLSSKLFNRVIPGIVPEFEVSLAYPYDSKRTKNWSGVLVEPKLDGIRCIAMVRNGSIMMLGRSGKEIENFRSTIGRELLTLPDGCYDGELVSSNFQSLMEQAYRKEAARTDNVRFHIFDYLTLQEWDERQQIQPTWSRRNVLELVFDERSSMDFLCLVPQFRINAEDAKIRLIHDKFVTDGFEGAMIKNPDAGYTFGRSHDVMKLKAFHDIDLTI
jgi:DNA ligase-1